MNKYNLPEGCVVMDFRPEAENKPMMVSANAGLIPDRASAEDRINEETQIRAGLFQDEMPQNIVTRVYNYHLDYIILCGKEDHIYIDNLTRTLIPDISPNLKIWKAE